MANVFFVKAEYVLMFDFYFGLLQDAHSEIKALKQQLGIARRERDAAETRCVLNSMLFTTSHAA
jgi:hypothetical protein